MRLIERLAREAEQAPSIVTRALAREDLQRLEKLLALAAAYSDLKEFTTHGLMVGWTRGDLRTLELKATLEPVLALVHAIARGEAGTDAPDRLDAAWGAFHLHRLEVLVHCL